VFERDLIGTTKDNPSALPVLIACGAMLAGYTHMTYSLLIIMLETTTSINLFIPMMISILVSRAISKPMTRSLYERALRTKQVPSLKESVPKANRRIKVKEAMV
jgi:H+/Cl- antiporter ClcA